jgi:hypothetical protein
VRRSELAPAVVADVEHLAAAWGVAVAGWEWHRWKEEVGAVRMVVVR